MESLEAGMTMFNFLPLALRFNGFAISSAGVLLGGVEVGVPLFPLFTLTTFAFPRRTV